MTIPLAIGGLEGAGAGPSLVKRPGVRVPEAPTVELPLVFAFNLSQSR
jgi:hypothetical protein